MQHRIENSESVDTLGQRSFIIVCECGEVFQGDHPTSSFEAKAAAEAAHEAHAASA
jgi:hypothetical protein